MSLINDALKRAHESQGKEPAPAPPLMAPVAASPPSTGFGWFLPSAVVLVLVAAVLFIWLAVAHKSSKPAATHAVAAVAPAVPTVVPTPPNHPAPAAAPAPVAVSPVPVAPKAAETQPVPAVDPGRTAGLLTARLPKVQGIIFSQPPTAIVNGKVVNIGDHVGYFLVKQITRNKVIFQSADGSEQQLAVGE